MACDVAVLVFDPSSQRSLDYILALEQRLPARQPRILVSTKHDLTREGARSSSGTSKDPATAAAAARFEEAYAHCVTTELQPPVVTSATARLGTDGPNSVPDRIMLTALDPESAVPFSRSHKRKRDRRRFWVRLACLGAFASAAAVLGVSWYKRNEELVKGWYKEQHAKALAFLQPQTFKIRAQ